MAQGRQRYGSRRITPAKRPARGVVVAWRPRPDEQPQVEDHGQQKLPPRPQDGDALPLYRNGCFYPPHRDRSHVPGPQETALLELWQDWTRREAGLRQEFMAMLRELDARRGDLFSYAVSDLGRNADTMFSPQCLLDSLFQSRTEAEQRFSQALDDASLHLRLSLNVAVALGR